ncbi:hypothetical protein [Lachnospira sp.]|jgi:hypothetical protein|uniref:hypothetical protein n=1 Tax=Lachnospira sp. TaxID=2049031 RepID=UPI002580B802|nr:hypothetical protein [Lachnospira sp.]
MEKLDFAKNKHSLDPLGKDTLCTVIILIPNGIDESTIKNLEESFNKCITYIGLGHVDSEGFTEDKANVIVADHRIPKEDLDEIFSFCEELSVIPLSFYMRYEDLDNSTNSFMGKVIPVV